jgi:hypothetical protein
MGRDSHYLYFPNDHVLVFLNSQFLFRYYWNALAVMEPEDIVTDLLEALLGGGPCGYVLAHAPRNNIVEVVPSCLRMDSCYAMHARWRNTTVAIMWYVRPFPEMLVRTTAI